MQYRLKELVRQEEREKDAKRLKEFVEDYDDERDDALYYRGRELQQRLAERVREADADSKDREKEADELAELKNKIFSGEFENPSQEYEKARREIEKLYEPRILINVNLEAAQRREQEQLLPGQQQERRKQQQQQQPMADAFESLESAAMAVVAAMAGVVPGIVPGAPPSEDSISTNDDRASMADTVSNASGYSHLKNSNNNNISNNNNESVSRQNSESRDSLSHIHTPTMMESDHGGGGGGGVGASVGASAAADVSSSATPPMSMPLISLTLGNNLKKKIEATGVFVNDDDNDENINPKKRKLVPLGEYKLL